MVTFAAEYLNYYMKRGSLSIFTKIPLEKCVNSAIMHI